MFPRRTQGLLYWSALCLLAQGCIHGTAQHEPPPATTDSDGDSPTPGGTGAAAKADTGTRSGDPAASEGATPRGLPGAGASASAQTDSDSSAMAPSMTSDPSSGAADDDSDSGGGDGSLGAEERAAAGGGSLDAPASDAAEAAGEADLTTSPSTPSPEGPEPVPPAGEDPVARPPQAGLLTAGAWDDNLNFERFSEYRNDLLQEGLSGALPFENTEHGAAHERFAGERPAHSTLDVALVIDTTGSMGDEIRYLQTEFRSLAATIADRYPQAEQRWSLVVYRDQGDSYVTRSSEFTTDVEVFRTELGQQGADGGGDFPEAPEEAFAVMNALQWRSEDSAARLAFWVADAPHHRNRAEALADRIRDTEELGVHIYPVASSGIDELTELTMRSAAQLTGGRYLFLTDDSGIGGAHKEPSIPCYFVTRLHHAILRMIDIELTGEYREPDAEQIIRTGGDPEDGACTLPSGDQVAVF